MTIKQLNQREKILAIVILIVLLIGGYVSLRFEPRLTEIEKLNNQKDATLTRISKLEIPEEPRESIAEINAELDDLEKALIAIKENAKQIEEQLAPIDSQELRVRISELARDSGIRIRVNQVFKAEPISIVEKNGRPKEPVTKQELIPPYEFSWINKLAPNSMFHRPMQRLEIDADYPSLRRFIHGLDNLPYQVTVVRMNIEKLEVAPLRGMSQLLKSELVLAL
ncbi:hypothetical protein [Methylophaga sp. OBS3]|uniref:hypothetical protein n=1 Tax=Methylophaga sp. OBS3 TaxID=2991934 RepID=UPI00225AF36B|nr:hypothetical protein [Methylophaga sp. OBS3]MCX4189164.1 hypothetical protein [Methylophaga sp. OBS3]